MKNFGLLMITGCVLAVSGGIAGAQTNTAPTMPGQPPASAQTTTPPADTATTPPVATQAPAATPATEPVRPQPRDAITGKPVTPEALKEPTLRDKVRSKLKP